MKIIDSYGFLKVLLTAFVFLVKLLILPINVQMCIRQVLRAALCGIDPDIGIQWPLKDIILSDKDQVYSRLKDVPVERLPVMGG